MSQVRSAATVILVVTILAGAVYSQNRPRTKSKPSTPGRSKAGSASTRRSVTINLIRGGQVIGIFLRADAEAVQVEVESGRVTVDLNDIASIVFTTDEARTSTTDEASNAQPAAADQSLTIARKAYAALDKLADAAQLKLPYPQYGSLVIEVKSVVEEAAAALPDDSLKFNLIQALETYKDAAKAYSAAQQIRGRNPIIPISSEPGATLMRKYDIRPETNNVGQADHLALDLTLSTIWARAGTYLKNASYSLGQ